MGFRTFPPVTWDLIIGFIKLIIKYIPFLSLFASIGFVIGLRHKKNLILFCLTWAMTWYIFHTFYFGYYIGWPYLFSLILALTLPSAYAFLEIFSYMKKFKLNVLLIVILLFWQMNMVFSTPVFYTRGYEEAGQYVAENLKGKSVLFYGKYDGSFMMGIRRKIAHNGPRILRGERQLATRFWWGELKENTSIKSCKEILEILENYQVGYIVIESMMPSAKEFEEYQNLLTTLNQNTNLFQEEKRIPLMSNYRKIGNELIIYKFNFDEKQNNAKELIISIPTMKRDIKVTL
jgi:hypothetical protein